MLVTKQSRLSNDAWATAPPVPPTPLSVSDARELKAFAQPSEAGRDLGDELLALLEERGEMIKDEMFGFSVEV
jgi:hypothetical protein